MKISAKYICQHDSRNEIQMTILSTMMEYRHLQSELGAPPVSPLSVVPDGVSGPHPGGEIKIFFNNQDNLSILTTYLIHWGMGRFCFIFFASFCLMRKVLRADIIWNDGNVHLTLLHHNVNRFNRSFLMSYSDKFDSEDIHIRVAHVLFWIYPD